MCKLCYEAYGWPEVNTPAVKQAAQAITEVFRHHDLGGALHVVIEDWNLEDEHLDACGELIERTEDEQQQAAERTCYQALKQLSLAERASAVAIEHGFYDPDEGGGEDG